MRLRIITGVVAVLTMFPVLYFTPVWVPPLVVALLSGLAVQELLGTTRLVKSKRIITYGTVFAALVPVAHTFDVPNWLNNGGLFLFVFLLFVEGVTNFEEVPFDAIGVTLFAGLIIPLFMMSLIRLKEMPLGNYLVMLPFVIAFCSDAAAYFVGRKLGKTQIAPAISPKKTVEGAVGGFAGAIFCTLLYGVVITTVFPVRVNYLILALYAVLGAFASVMGDLSFSYIKRGARIKDFGNVMPGHGGILDRFDSILFAAPLLEVLVIVLPAIERIS